MLTNSCSSFPACQDEEVTESYRISCHPRWGITGTYLAQARPTIRIGDALFVHGDLPLVADNDRDNDSDGTLKSTTGMGMGMRTRTRGEGGEVGAGGSEGGRRTSIWDDLGFTTPWKEREEISDDDDDNDDDDDAGIRGAVRTTTAAVVADLPRRTPAERVRDWTQEIDGMYRDGIGGWSDHVGRTE